MGTCLLDPGERHLLHHHPARSELYYVLEGTAEMTVGEDVFRAEPGMGVYIRRGVTHGFTNDGVGPFKILWVFDVPTAHEGADLVWDEPL